MYLRLAKFVTLLGIIYARDSFCTLHVNCNGALRAFARTECVYIHPCTYSALCLGALVPRQKGEKTIKNSCYYCQYHIHYILINKPCLQTGQQPLTDISGRIQNLLLSQWKQKHWS